MDEAERKSRAAVFDSIAEEYDAIRPGFPAAAFEYLAGWAGVGLGARVLEVGCGTGLASLQLARRGYRLTCLEPSPNMAHFASRKLESFDAEVLTMTFEDYALTGEPFDLAVAANAFHLLDPQSRCDRLADMLGPGCVVAVISNTHPDPFAGFSRRVQTIYSEVVPEWTEPHASGAEDVMRKVEAQLVASGRFDPVETQCFDWSLHLSRDEFLQLLGTFSDHRLLEPERRETLFARIGALVDEEFEGVVDRPYRTVLSLGRRKLQ